jgi:hypothetical protein
MYVCMQNVVWPCLASYGHIRRLPLPPRTLAHSAYAHLRRKKEAASEEPGEEDWLAAAMGQQSLARLMPGMKSRQFTQ